jgi:hypothetical protein
MPTKPTNIPTRSGEALWRREAPPISSFRHLCTTTSASYVYDFGRPPRRRLTDLCTDMANNLEAG